ncbi:hypothetical protein WQ54_13545 [Bacillus sp. SA1-12]|uniref:hypothetical protein n=1 Tax=Bacillus sp. SA1-12 TaxID=1455638 RepID=UPI0006265305|nr:hypothetical protein [Bacillus sp. SA1-12]KKI91644.1 hypothetical protein WQ54_13545 [Bacillus sp. SA1-12]
MATMNNIIHFQALRKEKEKQLSSFICQHAASLHHYVARDVNIREKVKAKHIFSEKVGCVPTSIFSKMEEQLFLDWFAYDYATIRGITIYQTFVEQLSKKGHPLDRIVHALFMASVLEPFKVIKCDGNHIYAEKLITGEKCTIKSAANKYVAQEEIIFLRSIPVFDQLLCISDLYVQRDQKSIVSMLQHFEGSSNSWRTFLKKFAINYSWTSQPLKEK